MNGGLAEPADSNGSSVTDPGNNWVNGVNSHKHCLVNCNAPPTTTSGVLWQDKRSPLRQHYLGQRRVRGHHRLVLRERQQQPVRRRRARG